MSSLVQTFASSNPFSIDDFRHAHPELLSELSEKPPEISWVPSYDRYRECIETKKTYETQAAVLPKGWPAHVGGSLCWDGRYFDEQRKKDEVYVQLSATHIDEIEDALEHFCC
jgi:hypothetical protein